MSRLPALLRRVGLWLWAVLTWRWVVTPDDGDVLTYQDPQVGGLSQAFKPPSGGAQTILSRTVTLTDAQIKALPTTPIELVAAQGAGTVLIVLTIYAQLDTAGGAYTNLDATACLLYTTVGSQTPTAQFNENLFGMLGQAALNVIQFPAYADVDLVSAFLLAGGKAAAVNQSLTLTGENNGAGNWTGGNAANSMKLTTIYAVIDA